MQVKRYFAQDMRRALQKVREELGDEAVILSNRTLENGVEVIASPYSNQQLSQKWEHQKGVNAFAKKIDVDPYDRQDHSSHDFKSNDKTQQHVEILERNALKNREFIENLMKKNKSLSSDYKKIKTAPSSESKKIVYQSSGDQLSSDDSVSVKDKKSKRSPVSNAYKEEVESLKVEVKLLKELLKSQLTQTNWVNFNYSQPISSYLFKQLAILGFSSSIACDWLETASQYVDLKQAWEHILDKIIQDVPIRRMPFAQETSIIALVGPTGAGKTTTLAKLAAQHMLEQGKDGIALVTTDTYRIGAQEQLQTMGRIMGVPVKIAENQQSLTEILETLSDKRLVLVDTAGLTRHDQGWEDQWLTIKNHQKIIKTLLVLPCTQQELILNRVVEDFKSLDLHGCIFTKLDESSSLGEVLSVVIKHNLPITYVADGLSIPEDIHMAHADDIVHHAVKLSTSRNIDDQTMAHLFENSLSNHSVISKNKRSYRVMA